MNLSIEIRPTEEFVLVKGIVMRAWKGLTADGKECKVLVCTVAFPDGQPPSALQSFLQETPSAIVLIDPVTLDKPAAIESSAYLPKRLPHNPEVN